MTYVDFWSQQVDFVGKFRVGPRLPNLTVVSNRAKFGSILMKRAQTKGVWINELAELIYWPNILSRHKFDTMNINKLNKSGILSWIFSNTAKNI